MIAGRNGYFVIARMRAQSGRLRGAHSSLRPSWAEVKTGPWIAPAARGQGVAGKIIAAAGGRLRATPVLASLRLDTNKRAHRTAHALVIASSASTMIPP